MKNVFIITLFFSISQFGFSQDSPNETQKLSTLCKVWGFLKYYHPKVARGKYDWDAELVKKIPQIKFAKSKTEINKIYVDWIDGFGKVKKRNCKNDYPDSLKKNLNIRWINDSTVFEKELIVKLNFIKENRSRKEFYVKHKGYVPTFKNEKPYKDSIFPSETFRLLSLYRYWNIINYYFPSKYLIDRDWNDVLTEMIPKFLFAKDTTEYHLGLLELITRIQDSHAWFWSKYTNAYFGKYYLPAEFKIIEDKAIITKLFNDSICKLNDIQLGDVITKMNNKTIAELINENLKYTSGSNLSAQLRDIPYRFIPGNSDTVRLTFERNHLVSTKTVKRYRFKNFKYKEETKQAPPCKTLGNNIGYINMGVLINKQVDSVMSIMMDKKAIIFDVRNYPNGTILKISNYLNKQTVPFVLFTNQDPSYPGMIYNAHYSYCGKGFLRSGHHQKSTKIKQNPNYYKGKVIVLFNEETQSHAEYTCMALQTAPNVTCIGSPTAGADGNVTDIIFPGGFLTWMSSLGVYYPDGRKTQRIGIIPNIEVRPTIEGIQTKKDEVLERAIEYINSGK